MNLNQYKGQAFTVPNILSYLRLILIPVFVIVFLSAKDNARLYLTATAILLVSGATDLFDGCIARKYHQITALGKLLDPLADKLTCITVTICLCIKIPTVLWLAVLYCVKEGAMIAGGIFLIRNNREVAGSKWFGKIATFVFYISMLFLVAAPYHGVWMQIINGLIILNMALILFAFCMYIPVFFRLWHTPPKEKAIASDGKEEQ